MGCRACGPEACGILVPQPGIKPMSTTLESGFLTTGSPGKSSSTSFLLSVFLEYNISSVEGKSFCLNCFMMSPMHLHLQWTFVRSVNKHNTTDPCSLSLFSLQYFQEWKRITLGNTILSGATSLKGLQTSSCIWLDPAFFFPLVPDRTYWNAQNWLTL